MQSKSAYHVKESTYLKKGVLYQLQYKTDYVRETPFPDFQLTKIERVRRRQKETNKTYVKQFSREGEM